MNMRLFLYNSIKTAYKENTLACDISHFYTVVVAGPTHPR
jgi:hypothetical protein